jgi:hypothetical protein
MDGDLEMRQNVSPLATKTICMIAFSGRLWTDIFRHMTLHTVAWNLNHFNDRSKGAQNFLSDLKKKEEEEW